MLSPKAAGFTAALSAYILWGMLPFYMKALGHVSIMEVVAHRILWSVPVTGAIILCLGRTQDLLKALKSPKLLALACLTSALISINWIIYVWAISNNHTIDAALGYYINPLFNVLIGALFLKEKLMRMQWLAVALAAGAVGLLTIEVGGLPWVALALPLTFGCYGLLHKALPIGPLQGFMLEALILFLPAIIWEGALISKQTSLFWHGGWSDFSLLLLAGPITAIPLILFAKGAKTLNFITLGLMQYIVPTCLFVVAIFIFHEPFSHLQLLAFSLIWSGLILYSFVSIKQLQRPL